MAVTRIGSVAEIHSNTDPSSGSVTVPDDAELMIVAVGGWFGGTANGFVGIVAEDAETSLLTLNGVNFKVGRRSDGIGGNDAAAVLYLVSPSTGSQTLAWNWSGGVTNGIHIHYAFYKGIDTSSPIRSRGGEQINPGTTATAGTLSASSGDVGVAVYESYTAAASSWAGVTELIDNNYNSANGGFADDSLAGNTAISVTVASSGYVTIAAVVLKQAAAGGVELAGGIASVSASSSLLPYIYHYLVNNQVVEQSSVSSMLPYVYHYLVDNVVASVSELQGNLTVILGQIYQYLAGAVVAIGNLANTLPYIYRMLVNNVVSGISSLAGNLTVISEGLRKLRIYMKIGGGRF